MSDVTEEVATLGHNRLIALYAPFRDALAESQAEDMEFNYEDKDGNKAARSYVAALRKAKAEVDRARKAEKQESLEYGRLVDSEAKGIISAYDALINQHAEPIKAIEERETERIQRHTESMTEIRLAGEDARAQWNERTAEAMQERLDEIKAGPRSEEHWEEFAEQADGIIETAIKSLEFGIAKRKEYDAEQAELAELRRQNEERERQESEASAAQERQEREDRIRREAAENAEREARETLEREQREEAEVAAAREKDRKHKSEVNKSAALALVKHAEIDEDVAKRVVSAIAKQQIPAVRISY